MAKKECEHIWYLFKDKDLVGTNELSFFCKKCLKLKKIKKEYKDD